MFTNLRIALRFILAKKRAMLMSLVGISFGVGFIVLTQAVTSGFQDFFIATILGTDGAIKIEDKFQMTVASIPIDSQNVTGDRIEVESMRRYIEGIPEPHLIRKQLGAFPEILGVSEVVRGSVQLQSATREETAQVLGITVEDHMSVSRIQGQVIQGSIEDFNATPFGILVGSDLARRLRVNPGDSVFVTFAGIGTRYRVVGIYETGVRDIDRIRVFMHLQAARNLLKRPFGASYIQVTLQDPNRAPQIARQIEASINHRATEWQERERPWLSVFRFFRISAAITVSTIIIVAGLGMFNTLAMIVMEKTKEIAILRSMGFTRHDIATTFMLQGCIVLVVGVSSGWAFGAAFTWIAESLPIHVRGVFSTDHLVVTWSFDHYLGAALAAAIVILIASWLPARRAARLEPAGIIRGTSQ